MQPFFCEPGKGFGCWHSTPAARGETKAKTATLPVPCFGTWLGVLDAHRLFPPLSSTQLARESDGKGHNGRPRQRPDGTQCTELRPYESLQGQYPFPCPELLIPGEYRYAQGPPSEAPAETHDRTIEHGVWTTVAGPRAVQQNVSQVTAHAWRTVHRLAARFASLVT